MKRTPPDLTPLLGRHFVQALREDAALVIGRDRFSKIDLARMGIVQTKAAGILTRIAKDLGSKSVRHLFDHSSPYTFASYPAGVTTIYVVLAVFQAKGLSITAWYEAGKSEAIRTFTTLKTKELKAARAERRAARRRPQPGQSGEHVTTH